VRHAPVLVLLIPAAGAIVATFLRGRTQAWVGVLVSVATLTMVMRLADRLVHDGPQRYAMADWMPPLGISLYADGLALLMLLLTALAGTVVSVYAASYFTDTRDRNAPTGLFWPLWLLLWGGLNALFVAGDIFTLYLLLEFTLVAAVALSAVGGSVAGQVSALRYLLAATTAGVFYLLGVTLVYAEAGTLDLHALREMAPSGLFPTLALTSMTGALLLKCALVPLHFWLPAAHSTAPAPVSAILSALVVKAGFYVIVRLWLEALPHAAPPAADWAVATLGASAVLWGSWRALRQHRLKMLVAYSTVAQVGYLFVLFPLAAAARTAVVEATTYHVLSHGLAKAAFFLAAGAVVKTAHSDRLERTRGAARRAPFAVVAMALSGAALAGVLPGFGPKGKLIGLALDHGQWWWAGVMAGGMALAAAYTIAAVRHSFEREPPAPPDAQERAEGAPGENDARPPTGRILELAALGLTAAAFALSWASDRVLALLEIGWS
jgi:multicomponent Na+:H+ antiporter subunit D